MSIRRIEQDLDRFAAKVVRSISRSVAERLPEDTPKQTGFTASNWVASVGVPFAGVAGSRQAVNKGAQEAGLAEISRYSSLKLGTIFVVNNTDSIVLLNAGSSPQAPANFVDASIRAALAEPITYGGGA